MTTEKTLLTTSQAAQVLGLASQTLRLWRLKGNGPQYIKLGPNRVRYDLDALNAWLTERTFVSTADAATR